MEFSNEFNEASKAYLYSGEIPHLFECLMSGLIHHQPANHFDFLRNCLGALKQSGGVDVLRWDSFIDFDKGEFLALSSSDHSTRRKSRTASGKGNQKDGESSQPEPLSMSFIDHGRQNYLSPTATLAIIYVGPISSKGSFNLPGIPENAEIVEAFTSGFANLDSSEDENLREELISKLFKHKGSDLVIVINYPRNATQLKWLLDRVGGVSFAVFVDYTEDSFQQRLALPFDRGLATSVQIKRILKAYRTEVMPVVHWFDRSGKLFVIEEKSDDYVQEQIVEIFNRQLDSRSISSVSTVKNTEISETLDIVPINETIPKANLKHAHLYLVIVGPVPNYSAYKLSLANKARHFIESSSAIEKLPPLMSSDEKEPIVCLNFPNNQSEFDWFLRNIGVDFVKAIFVDNTENMLRNRLENAHMQLDLINETIRKYKQNVLPIVHWLDRAGKLRIIDGEIDDAAVSKRVAAEVWQ